VICVFINVQNIIGYLVERDIGSIE